MFACVFMQRLMDKDVAIQAKEEEVVRLGENLDNAKRETVTLEVKLAETLCDKGKAEARLCECCCGVCFRLRPACAQCQCEPCDVVIVEQRRWRLRS